MKINGKYQNFTIDTGSLVTIMPNNPKLYNPKDIRPLKERYQDVNKNEIKFLGRVWANIEYNGETKKLPILITQRDDITPLLGGRESLPLQNCEAGEGDFLTLFFIPSELTNGVGDAKEKMKGFFKNRKNKKFKFLWPKKSSTKVLQKFEKK